MKIAIESPESLQDEQLEQIIDIWNEKTKENLCVVHHILMIRTHEANMYLKLLIYTFEIIIFHTLG